MSANERTFQGELYRIINQILVNDNTIDFLKVTQEENVGTKGHAKFSDGQLKSKVDQNKRVFIELKNSRWDATDEDLVKHTAKKAFNNGVDYFITGTPRQLAIYRTYQPNTTLAERKIKVYTLSNILKDDDVMLPTYEKEITPKLVTILSEISQLVHGVKEIFWDSIDKIFVNKLSAYILEASASMLVPVHEQIHTNKKFRQELEKYLTNQDIFNLTFDFSNSDVYKICQLANYLLFLKIMFYSYLQRDVKSLRLKPLDLPEDTDLLNKTLRLRFNDVLEHDYQLIFNPNILESFKFENSYIPVFKYNVSQIQKLNFHDLNADIIGAIYNTLIDNQEQHDRGQHFTNTNEVDIVNGFCINENTTNIIDTGCGAGTFLVRAYQFLKHYNPKLTHEKLLEHLWGIEIASFPTFLSTMNLCLLDIKVEDNYPVIIQSDFAKIQTDHTYSGMFLNVSKSFKVKTINDKWSEVSMPTFDACVGNPPYIRHELITDKEVWNDIIQTETGIKKINQQSDLYVYYLMHTATFLKDGGRLGYVISASWLDINFGAGLQKYLLDNFKIICIIDNQKTRSFETASVNTVILILEKCSNRIEREKNIVKFVRIFNDYDSIISQSNNSQRIQLVNNFCYSIERIVNSVKNDSMQVEIENQFQLEQNTTINNKYENGHWGAKYLRSPEIYNKIIRKATNKLVPLISVADVEYGIKSGANDFFYLQDFTLEAIEMEPEEYQLMFGISKNKHLDTWQHFGWYLSELTGERYIIEKQYFRPLFKTQKEAENLSVNKNNLKYVVLICSDSKDKLSKQKRKILNYIQVGESKPYEIHKRPSCHNSPNWYDLSSKISIGDFIFPSKVGEKFRLIDNREARVCCDKVNYVITIKDEYKYLTDVIFLLLNSIFFRFQIDLFSRQLTGKQTLSDVDVNLVEYTPIIKPELISNSFSDISRSVNSLSKREQKSIFEEVLKSDRKEIEQYLFKCIGLSNKDVESLFHNAVLYVKNRQEKSESVVLVKTKQKLTYEESLQLIRNRIPEVKPYKKLISNLETQKYIIPDWKAVYPKNVIGTDNLFALYNVYFIQGNKKKELSFSSSQQLELFHFLNSELDVKDTTIHLPKKASDCEKLLKSIKNSYEEHISIIRNILKTNRSTANYVSIYKDLLFN